MFLWGYDAFSDNASKHFMITLFPGSLGNPSKPSRDVAPPDLSIPYKQAIEFGNPLSR